MTTNDDRDRSVDGTDDHDVVEGIDGELDDDVILGEQLRTLLDPQTDLTSRTIDDVDRTLRARSALATGLDLLGIGWWTMRAVLTDGATSADQDEEGS